MRPARTPRPRTHVHRGSVEGAALWFDPTLLGEMEARRRVLAGWTPGAGVYALAGGFLLRLPAPRRMDCAGAPGLPFTLEDGVLLSAPLSPSERERLAPTSGTAVLVRAGTAEVHPLESSGRVDVSTWLDVSGWDVVPVEGLGAPPPPVATLVPVTAPTRASFGLGAPAPEAEVMRARMEARPVPQPARAPGLLDRLRAWWRGSGGQASSGSRSSKAVPGKIPRTSPPPPPGPGLLSRLAGWLATSTPLGPLLGRRKAEYVRRLFDLFDEGNLQEALRYAIPLGKGGLSEQARVSLGLPGPREQLAIQPRQGGAVSIFGGGAAVYQALRERYRQAFRKLEREGRIEEAAFVLAELLHEEEEAVSFLERHGRFRLAAELAEGRKLAPGLVVRQWVLAKDVARAVDIARRTGAFADAVPRLERTHPAEARVLRLLWGEVLAQSGDYARAVDVVWPVEDARRLTREWLERGMEAGGVSGARLLARGVLAFPESFDTTRERVLALLDSEEAEGVPARQAFTEALAREVERRKTDVEAGLVLLRPAVRALLRDRAAGHLPMKPRDIENLVRLTGDPVLRADLPPLPPPPERAGFPSDGKPVDHVFDVGEGGPWPIHDAVPLSGGRLLVALGEAGARLVTSEGRCVAHFDVPAFSLVLSVHEDRALALAPRGTLKRISRLDLVRRRAEPWCDTRAEAFAPVYDGNLWFIAVEDTVMAVDALAAEPRALWRVAQVGGRVLAVEVGPSEMSFATLDTEAELKCWTYSLPGPTLRSRQMLPGGKVEEVRHLSLRMDGELAVLAQDGVRWFGPHARPSLLPKPLETALRELVLGGAWLATLKRTPTGEEVCLAERTQGAVRARFLFEGEHPVSVCFLNGELLLFDTAGRLARVELTRGAVRRVVLC
ncbi:bpX6 domain-containing protein [Archangium sp.]|uniref:bpX6 domain-containing protein n=1 Tax=Archangium sp. TaxID=1872627 RepID=UPI002D5FC364|nr:bpX6 domain-containing protein [Archangium sp.]HYO53889.1 bpX6 domain-containing protein [Archangium sp.]